MFHKDFSLCDMANIFILLFSRYKGVRRAKRPICWMFILMSDFHKDFFIRFLWNFSARLLKQIWPSFYGFWGNKSQMDSNRTNDQNDSLYEDANDDNNTYDVLGQVSKK
jgi:hypothetical protein